MQTIEKALHQPMPFTTGGQTITDRLNAAKHSLAGSQLGKTICKATTEELMAPKKKHLDYLLHCTNEPNVSIPQMANLLIERTQNPNWTVVYKALITIHNIMCYGNERFSQYLASCNTTFNLGNLMERPPTTGYDMSNHVRKYGKYIGEKIATYRSCAFDFCKVKRGREDGLLRTMHSDKLLKTLPVLQKQIDALLDFSVSAGELNNGVINCSFILLFRDLIRLFACYNDGVINLLEKYFDMNKKECREALDMYKSFLNRLDKVSEFLRVAESVGIDKGEIPDLTRAPASLLEALESHLYHLEGGRPPVSSSNPFSSQSSSVNPFQSQSSIGEAQRMKYLEFEKERLKQIEEERKRSGGGGSNNPFSPPTVSSSTSGAPDLIDIFNAPQNASPMDLSNPFANNPFGNMSQLPQQQMYNQGPQVSSIPSSSFSVDFNRVFNTSSSLSTSTNLGLNERWNPFSNQSLPHSSESEGQSTLNPFLTQEHETGGPVQTSQPISISGTHLNVYNDTPFSGRDSSYTSSNPIDQTTQQDGHGGDVDCALSSLAHNLDISGNTTQGKPLHWPNEGSSQQMMGMVGSYPNNRTNTNPYSTNTNPYMMHIQQQQQQWQPHHGMYGVPMGYGMQEGGMGAYGMQSMSGIPPQQGPPFG